MKLLISFALLFPLAVLGAEILEVGEDGKTAAISQSQDTPSFKMNDYLCVIDDEIELACGPVIKVLAKGAIMRFDFLKESVSSGDKVVFGGRRSTASYDPAAAGTSTETNVLPRQRIFLFDLTAGMLAGPNYQMALFHFQGMVTPRTSVGVMPLLMTTNQTSSQIGAYGAFLTANYYTSRYFKGFWFNAGIGGYFVGTPSTRRRLGVAAAIAHVGYRVRIYKGLNLGLAVGGQFMERPFTPVTFTFPTTQYTGMVDLGFSF